MCRYINVVTSLLNNIKNLYTEKLDNGLQVLYYYEPGKYTFYVEAIVNAGSAHEEAKNLGIAHFNEHVTSSSIKSYPKPKQLAKAFNRLGASFNASTSYSLVNYYGNFPISELDKGLKILYENIFEPTYNETTIDTQRAVILDEYLSYKDSKYTKFINYIYKKRFEDPLVGKQNDCLGTPKTLSSIGSPELKGWFNKFHHPENIILGGTGSVAPEIFFKKVKKVWGAVAKNTTKTDYIKPFRKENTPELTKQQILAKYDRTFEKAYLAISFPAFNLLDNSIQEYVTFRIIRDYIANSTSSRLFQQLREKHGLVYDVGANFMGMPNFGIWGIDTSFDISKLNKVVGILKKEISALQDGVFSTPELKSVQEYISKTFMMRYDYPNHLLNWYLSDYYENYITDAQTKVYTPEELLEMYNQTSKKDLQAIIPKILDFSKINVVLYGKFEEKKKDKIETKLKTLINE